MSFAGTAIGSPTYAAGATGFGQAIVLNGSTQYVSVPVAEQMLAYPHMGGTSAVEMWPGYAASIAWLDKRFDIEYGRWLEGQQD